MAAPIKRKKRKKLKCAREQDCRDKHRSNPASNTFLIPVLKHWYHFWHFALLCVKYFPYSWAQAPEPLLTSRLATSAAPFRPRKNELFYANPDANNIFPRPSKGVMLPNAWANTRGEMKGALASTWHWSRDNILGEGFFNILIFALVARNCP